MGVWCASVALIEYSYKLALFGAYAPIILTNIALLLIKILAYSQHSISANMLK